MSRKPLFMLLLALAVLAPARARAAEASRSFGPDIGFSTDPGQVLFGGHLSFGNVAPDLDFVPSLEIGAGDNVTVVALNGDFHYRFHVAGARWQPYAGAGVSLFNVSGTRDAFGGSSNVGGGSLIGGADVPTDGGSRFFAEVRLALGDGPSFRAVAGWSFPMR